MSSIKCILLKLRKRSFLDVSMCKVFVFLIVLLIGYTHFMLGYEYPRPIQGYYSQKGQDRYLNENLFKDKHEGFFIEVGAHDGISFSNTYFFEKHLGWHGICIDPNPNIFSFLQANRNCICEQLCISDVSGEMQFLLCGRLYFRNV